MQMPPQTQTGQVRFPSDLRIRRRVLRRCNMGGVISRSVALELEMPNVRGGSTHVCRPRQSARSARDAASASLMC